MVNKDNFKLKEMIERKIFEYDDQGNKYTKTIKGIVYQITNDFIVIDNGVYKEAFKYCQFEENRPMNIEDIPYDLSLESYSSDIVKNCIDLFNKGKEGFVFNIQQLNNVIENIEGKFKIKEEEGIYYIKKI